MLIVGPAVPGCGFQKLGAQLQRAQQDAAERRLPKPSAKRKLPRAR